MPEMINPLRYPGAKRFLADYIDKIIQANNLKGCRFYEPYAGSAAVGIELLQRGTINTLVLCEKDILISAFWSCVFFHKDDLCDLIQKTPVSIETWINYEKYRRVVDINECSILELGFAGLFFNRTNFSGILKANPIGGKSQKSNYKIDCRFNKEGVIRIIQKLSEYRNNVEVYFGDALEFMKKEEKVFVNEPCFAYFDPPYYNKGAMIYRHYYREQDHINLCSYVDNVQTLKWLISYDDAPFINELYKKRKVQYRHFHLDYSCANKVRTRGQELLISNLALPCFPT